MTERTFVVDESGHHHVVIADGSGWPAARALLSTLRTNHLDARFIRPRLAARRSWLQAVLASQPMGSRLYVAGTASFVGHVRHDAFFAGLSDAELAVICIGPPAPYVFCMVCYHRFNHSGTNTAVCPSCGHWLELTEHVSDRLQSVMGAVALPPRRHHTSEEQGDYVG